METGSSVLCLKQVDYNSKIKRKQSLSQTHAVSEILQRDYWEKAAIIAS